ncbi:alpha/beta fold hydrolase [Gordonia humi]|uniref:Proline iminopeptidase n=1 Tax=Gordonia humi TaxID=686429 RepID=A0A840FCI5_9ACTN|nr:alpha/beta fold hydrolase [Gordonia humi]MBB4137207.1 proline iminopeptidase [Gordonia humi]
MPPDPNSPRASLLDVDDQRLYVEECGAPHGVPALFLHGGPGGTLGTGAYRERFPLERVRLVSFEQRGCGRSVPHASDPATSLETNTSQALIGDIEAVRTHLGIDRWIVNGISWGSSLALAYAQACPERVSGLVLVAVTAGSRHEIDWITEGVSRIFPEAWDRFASHAEAAGVGYRRGRDRLVNAYARLLDSPDDHVRDAASREWARWEDTHISIGTGGLRRDPRWDDDRFRLAFTRLAAHYWSHDCFFSPPLLERMDRVAGIRGYLIHGRRDVSGPAETAWRLHRAWPGSTLIVDEADGHGGRSLGEHWAAANDALVAVQRR